MISYYWLSTYPSRDHIPKRSLISEIYCFGDFFCNGTGHDRQTDLGTDRLRDRQTFLGKYYFRFLSPLRSKFIQHLIQKLWNLDTSKLKGQGCNRTFTLLSLPQALLRVTIILIKIIWFQSVRLSLNLEGRGSCMYCNSLLNEKIFISHCF